MEMIQYRVLYMLYTHTAHKRELFNCITAFHGHIVPPQIWALDDDEEF